MTTPRARTATLAAALFLLALALYARAAGNDFIAIDDPGYLENRWVRAGLTWDGVVWAFTREHSANWHPLTWLSHMLDVELFGTSPIGPHVVNALLHALNTALFFLFLQLTTARAGPSALVALFFAVHPQRVESVAWVAERKDVLSAFFFFVTLLLYARHARRPSRGSLALVALATALGLMAKPMLVTLPCVLLLLDLWPLGRWKSGDGSIGSARESPTACELSRTRRGVVAAPPSVSPLTRVVAAPSHDASGWLSAGGGFPHRPFARLVREKFPLFLLSAGSAVATLLAQASGIRDLEVLPFTARLANALESWGRYVLGALWPVDLAIFYPHRMLSGAGSASAWRAATLAAAVFVLGVSLWTWRGRSVRPWLATGWFWYLGMLVPVIGLVQVGGQSMADRYAYLPQVGLLLFVVFGLDAAVKSAAARRALAAVAVAAAGVLATLTWRQIGVWKDSETLLLHALAVTERNTMAHGNLGLWYLEQGDLPHAIEHFEARLALGRRPGTLVNLGVARSRNGETEAAIRCFEEALALDPAQDDAHANLAALLLERGDAAGALRHYEAALRRRPRSAEYRAGLERARVRLGE